MWMLLLFISLPYVLCHYKAVLIAGSKGWDNYRHQADIFHAYSELIRNNISPKDIILFAYNDIAYNPLNPEPGVVINRPNGPNVFPGNHSINYEGAHVTPINFLIVLKQLSHPSLDLLVYFSDHGDIGLIVFPNGEYLYVDQLKAVILSMKYRSFFFALESCFSASMFVDWIPNNTKMLALTATNDEESSWACYSDTYLNTYVGDCFSVNMLQFLDPADTYIETIKLLADVVANQTDTSPVSLYGDMSLLSLPLYKYWGVQQGGVSGSDKMIYHSKNAIVSWDVSQYIGNMTVHDTRFDNIRNQDNYERTLYHKLKRTLKLSYELPENYGSINSVCIRSAIQTLNAYNIKLSGYSNRFIKEIAIMCDIFSIPDVKQIIRDLSINYQIIHSN